MLIYTKNRFNLRFNIWFQLLDSDIRINILEVSLDMPEMETKIRIQGIISKTISKNVVLKFRTVIK